ncbi:MAG TPA: hypothetical protein PLJ21_03970 [Pseudobdellovibrionaceae bacterium]|nr:hypothetical protein [Pseudobdellovibrionaceae bacterium]
MSLFKTAHLALIFVSMSMLACEVKVSDANPLQDKFTLPKTTMLEGTWVSGCKNKSPFTINEITVLDFSESKVSYDSFQYSDVECKTLISQDHKTGQFVLGTQNEDGTTPVDYSIDLGSGAQQLFYDIVKIENNQLYIGEILGNTQEDRPKILDLKSPFSSVEKGYSPSPTPPAPVTPVPIAPAPVIPSETFLGETNLVLGDNFITSNRSETSSAYKIFKFSSQIHQKLNISSIWGSDSCSRAPGEIFEWTEVLQNGKMGLSQKIKPFDAFIAEANKNYILKFTLSGIKNCYASFTFTVARY